MSEPQWIDLGDGYAVLKAGDRISMTAQQLAFESLPEYETEYFPGGHQDGN